MVPRLALGFAAALLLATGIGFAGWGLFLALVPSLEPALAALVVGAVAMALAGLLLVPWGQRKRAAKPASPASPQMDELVSLAAEHPLAAIVLSTLAGIAESARR